MISINGVNTGGKGSADNYTMYVFPHFTVHNSKYTKHFFVGSQRILSKLGQPGTLDDIAIIEKVNGKNHIEWGIKQGNTNDHIQGHIKWVGDDGTLMTAGKSGKIPPGILKKYSDLQDDTTNTGGNTDKYERNQYFFHPDHLGNTSFITDASGEVSQHVEYLPFGEIMVDDRPVNDKNPYLYNGKELDEETGYYYYGSRYMDAQIGRFLNVDPIAEKYYWVTPYNYAENSPISNIDLWGMQKFPAHNLNKTNVIVPASYRAKPVTLNEPGGFSRKNVGAAADYWNKNAKSGSDVCIVAHIKGVRLLMNKPELKLKPRITDRFDPKEGFAQYLMSKGYAERPINIEYLDKNGKLTKTNLDGEPAAYSSSLVSSIKQTVGEENGFHAFSVSIVDGFHAMTLIYQKYEGGGQFYLADQGTEGLNEGGNEGLGIRALSEKQVEDILLDETQFGYDWHNDLDSQGVPNETNLWRLNNEEN